MPDRASEWTHAVLRVATGLLFLQHGMQKLFGLLGGMGGPGATAPLLSMMGLAGVLETVGGVMLVLGLLVRPAAALLVVEMTVAYVIAHVPRGLVPVQNEGELALLYAAIFLFLAANGAGPLSIDAWAAKRSPRDRRHVADRRTHAIA
jgi:putative oxidoreductase